MSHKTKQAPYAYKSHGLGVRRIPESPLWEISHMHSKKSLMRCKSYEDAVEFVGMLLWLDPIREEREYGNGRIYFFSRLWEKPLSQVAATLKAHPLQLYYLCEFQQQSEARIQWATDSQGEI